MNKNNKNTNTNSNTNVNKLKEKEKYLNFYTIRRDINGLLNEIKFIFYNMMIETCQVIDFSVTNMTKLIRENINNLKNPINLANFLANIAIINFSKNSNYASKKIPSNVEQIIKNVLNKGVLEKNNQTKKLLGGDRDTGEIIKFAQKIFQFKNNIQKKVDNINKKMKEIQAFEPNKDVETNVDCKYKQNLIKNRTELLTSIDEANKQFNNFENLNLFTFINVAVEIYVRSVKLNIINKEISTFSC